MPRGAAALATQRPDAEIRDWYAKSLRAGYEAAAGDAVSEVHEAEGLESLLRTSEHLASQMEHSIIDAPWTRGEIGKILNTWLENPNEEGNLLMGDLTAPLEKLFGPSRALMIARTEAAGVFNGGLIAGLRSHGWDQVNWIAAEDACEECQAMADDSPMAIDEAETNMPLHPNCGCTVEPYAEEEEGGDESEGGDGEEEYDEEYVAALKYSEDQPRDWHGRFGEGSGGEGEGKSRSVGGGQPYTALNGAKVPGLGKDQVYLVRYSEHNEAETEHIGVWAHSGRDIDNQINASSYYEPSRTTVDAGGKITYGDHQGYILVGRGSKADVSDHASGRSDSRGVVEVHGLLGHDNLDVVFDVRTGKEVWRKGK